MKNRYIYLVEKIRKSDYFRTIRTEYGWFKTHEECEEFCKEIASLESEYKFKSTMICVAAQYLPVPRELTMKERQQLRRDIYKLIGKKNGKK